jgi:hypothetical protein
VVEDAWTDPSPFLYDTALYASAGLAGVAALCNLMMKPVNPKFHMPEEKAAVPLASPPATPSSAH